MFIYPLFEGPALFKVGPIALPFYGLMYVVSSILFITLQQSRLKQSKRISKEDASHIEEYLFSGILIGGRIGDILLYNPKIIFTNPFWLIEGFLHNPTSLFTVASLSLWYLYIILFTNTTPPHVLLMLAMTILLIFEGGMSFHGAVLFSLLLLLFKFKDKFLFIVDFISPCIPPALGLGRFANFLNGELWGRPTHVSWGMVFPRADGQLRHPSQLYECLLEGVVLFIVLWMFSKKDRPKGAVFGLGITLYAIFRILVECFRDPSPTLGFIAWGWLTMGQLLSVPMLCFGILLLSKAYLPISRYKNS